MCHAFCQYNKIKADPWMDNRFFSKRIRNGGVLLFGFSDRGKYCLDSWIGPCCVGFSESIGKQIQTATIGGSEKEIKAGYRKREKGQD